MTYSFRVHAIWEYKVEAPNLDKAAIKGREIHNTLPTNPQIVFETEELETQ